MTEHASPEGQESKDDIQQHQGAEAEREASETGGGDRAEEGGQVQEEASSRPAMITPWYSDIDQN